MVNYVFETASSSDGAAFTGNDTLFFLSGSPQTITLTPTQQNQLTSAGITITSGDHSVTFSNAALNTASQNNHILFNGEDQSQNHLLIGLNGSNDTFTGATAAPASGVESTATQYTVYGFAGNDAFNFGNSTAANYIYGGFGTDTITVGSGNNHIYGNAPGTQGQLLNGMIDGNDTITAGGGTNYINGNAGADTITVGTAATAGTTAGVGGATSTTPATPASTGANHILGGADNDLITIQGAGANNVNGNTGNDTITATNATFNNTLHGGMGNDSITAGQGHDSLSGDLGSDTLVAGNGANHLTVMTGGNDTNGDIFRFNAGGASNSTTTNGTTTMTEGVNIDGTTYYQQVTDFQHGTDQIDLPFTINAGDVVHQQAGISFSSVNDATVSAASNYAQGLLDNHASSAGEVAAIQIGSDTFLFFNGANGTGTIDSVVQLHNVDASTLAQTASNGATAAGGNDFI